MTVCLEGAEALCIDHVSSILTPGTSVLTWVYVSEVRPVHQDAE